MSATTAGGMHLDGHFARELPELAIPWQAKEAPDPRLVVLNERLAADLELDVNHLRSPDGLALLTGSAAPTGATPVAQAYAGHQFGGYSPRLGDGRALLLGELTGRAGDLLDVHLKGSGPTPFSRGGDGFAVVGSMLREYIVSEAMHALGVPTTRSLAVVATGRTVRRETALPGAVLTRVARSHLRVGSFQFAASTGDHGLLQRLADHAIRRHAPEAASTERPYLTLFEAVVRAQAATVACWMRVGFVHGVMNTDNMTISGETIDYGPCAFIDVFNFGAVYSSIDHGGRYAYANQPLAAEWNLARFAESLLPLIDDDPQRAVELAVGVLGQFQAFYDAAWLAGMKAKLGLPDNIDDDKARSLATDLLALLHENRVDYTSFFRGLGAAARGAVGTPMLEVATIGAWAERWLSFTPDAAGMHRVNPIYIARNHLVEEALSAATDGDLRHLEQLLEVLGQPFNERRGFERYAVGAPDDSGPYTTYCGT